MTISYSGYPGPLPSPDFRRMVADEVMPPIVDIISGEVAANADRPLGIARYAGKIKSVNLSCADCGWDADAQAPYFSADVRINGASAMTTKPAIKGNDDESEQKTTFSEAGDTGVTEAVINTAANTFAIGDVLSWYLTYSGESSPDAKIKMPGIIIDFEPIE